MLCDCVPFKNVIVNGIILGADGKKMSKSDKNYSDPLDIIAKFGSDILRIYLLKSIAFDGVEAKIIEFEIEILYRKIVLQLQSSLKLYLEYMEFFENTKELSAIDELVCEANIWAVTKYNKIYDEYINLMNSYQFRDAINKLIEVIDLLNRDFNVILRPYYKDPSNPLCQETLIVMQYILTHIMQDFEPFLPCTSVEILGKIQKYDYLLSKSLTICDTNFQVVSDIINKITTLRGNNNISGRIPLSKISIPKDIFDKIQQCNSSTFFIKNACFILEIEPITSEDFPEYEIFPIKDEFFKKWKKEISAVVGKISKMSSRELNNIIDTEFEGFFLSKDLFRIKWHQREGKEEIIDHFLNSFIILNTEKTEKVIQHTEYRYIVREIQMMRKTAGLHPWNPVTIKWRNIGNAILDIKEIESLLGDNVTFVYDENFRDGTTIALGGVSVAVTQKFKVFDLNSMYVGLVF
jgi:isoleucyl-tRNA synthetase